MDAILFHMDQPYRPNPRGIIIDPAIESMPNFPFIITEETLRGELQPAKTEHIWRIDFEPHWIVYAYRTPDMAY